MRSALRLPRSSGLLLASSLALLACQKPAPPESLSSAPQSAEEATQAPELSGVRDLMIWEVQGAGLQPSYLFGSCHVGVGLDEALPQELRSLITGSDVFLMEVNPAELADPALAQLLFLPPGESVRALMGSEDWERTLDYFGLQAQGPQLEGMHPFALHQFLSTQVMAQREELQSMGRPGMMDLSLTRLAMDAEIPQAWLETGREQLEIFLSGVPQEQYAQAILQLMDPEIIDAQLKDMRVILDICRTGEFEEALELLSPEADPINDAIFALRNQSWLPKLEAQFQRGQVFAVVGAGHLIGEGNVRELLEASGYQLQRLRGQTLIPAPRPAGMSGIPAGEILEVMRQQLPTSLCMEDQNFRACFDWDFKTCSLEVEQAVDRCAPEIGLPDAIDPAESSTWGGRIGGCVGAKVTEEHRESILENPSCPL